MWVRMSTLQGDTSQSDDEVERQVQLLRENILPSARELSTASAV